MDNINRGYFIINDIKKSKVSLDNGSEGFSDGDK